MKAVKLSKAQEKLVELISKAKDNYDPSVIRAWHDAAYEPSIDSVILSRTWQGACITKTIGVLERLKVIEVKRVDLEFEYLHPKTGEVVDFSVIYAAKFDFNKVTIVNRRFEEKDGDKFRYFAIKLL